MNLLPVVPAREAPAQVAASRDEAVADQVAAIVGEVRRDGDRALLSHARRLGDLAPDGRWHHERDALETALARLAPKTRECLSRTADRIRRFAQAQRECLSDLSTRVAGGRAGHRFLPVAKVGCYAPGGRHPLPSSVLMTVVPARVAGVGFVQVATPRPGDLMLAAAALAGADRVIGVGGAQAIAALAYGTESVERCDLVAGPGNRWVTAAKKLVYGDVGIDMLAGPSELVVLADRSADPEVVAADLIAQAEHDVDARPVLVTSDAALAAAVRAALARQLASLPEAATATASLEASFCALASGLEEAVELCNRIAPEHLEVMVSDPEALLPGLRNYGALFVGPGSAEVFGDYGIGPNHVLPTGGGARFASGLSVLTFLRPATWMHLDASGKPHSAAAHCIGDAAALARLEGLEGHARAAERRQG